MPDEAASQPTDDFTRLHITPFDPDLLKIILPAPVAAQARNISYHTIETFPERRYGFVEVPNMDAEKIKKKLHGSVLKGVKVRVEKARPEERMEPTGEEDVVEEMKKKRSKDKSESKKRKRDPEVIDGVVLTDRKVKRGWTEPADSRRKKSKKDKETDKAGKTTEKKKRIKSKYTDQEECLLKMKLPPNQVGNVTEDGLPKKRKKKGKGREITVHEFEKTTKFPSFLKTADSESKIKAGMEFVEGKGWVDEDGDVVEAVKTKPVSTPKPKKSKVKLVEENPAPAEEDDDDAMSSSGTSSSGTSSDEEESEDEEEAQNETSALEQNESPIQHVHTTPLVAIKSDASRPASSSSARSLTIKIPPPITPSATKVHPLEALYKRNTTKPDETPVQDDAPFSFFSGANDDEDADDTAPTVNVPMTPFSRQDFEWRSTRSAAPTPDTAHPSRMKNFWAQEDGEDMEDVDDAPEGMLDDAPEAAAAEEGQQAGSGDFQSWFWEHRRDLNQSWMKRRKTAAKEKRHRENKARASRAV
ncbi:Fc.00g038460.m01.CDS01 [Cosmosporella sp. VM-42]